jgi:hypothetical protein
MHITGQLNAQLLARLDPFRAGTKRPRVGRQRGFLDQFVGKLGSRHDGELTLEGRKKGDSFHSIYGSHGQPNEICDRQRRSQF